MKDSAVDVKVGVGDDNENGLLEDELNAAIATLESISSTLDADCVRYATYAHGCGSGSVRIRTFLVGSGT